MNLSFSVSVFDNLSDGIILFKRVDKNSYTAIYNNEAILLPTLLSKADLCRITLKSFCLLCNLDFELIKKSSLLEEELSLDFGLPGNNNSYTMTLRYPAKDTLQIVLKKDFITKNKMMLEKINLEILKAENSKKMLKNILNILLDGFDCDRAWLLYPANKDYDTYQIPIIQTRDCWSVPDNLTIPMDDYSKSIINTALVNKVAVDYYSSKEPLLPDNIIKEHFVKSQLIYCLRSRIGENWLLGLHSCETEKQWTNQDKELFKNLAERITDGLNIHLYTEELRQLNKNLKDSEHYFQQIFNSVNDAIFIQEIKDGEIIDVNKTCLEIFGYDSKEEIIATGFTKIHSGIAPYNVKGAIKIIEEIVKRQRSNFFEWQGRKKNGEIIWTENSLSKINIHGEEKLMVLVRDIDKRKRAEQALEESEQKFRSLSETTATAIMIYQKEKWVYANPAAEKMCGYKQSELIHMNYWSFIAPEYREKARMIGAKRQQGNTPINDYEMEIVCKDGSRKWVFIQGAQASFKGNPAGLVSVMDISERKQAEQEMMKIQKLESIGTLAGGIAHDFNNILMGIYGNISLAKKYSSTPGISVSYLDNAENSLQRAQELTSQLLTFAKGGAPLKTDLKISEVIKKSVSFILSGSDIFVEYSFDPNLWSLKADKGQINQVLTNMILNSRQAMPNGGEIVISAHNAILKEDNSVSLEAGNYIKITIEDNGLGIKEKNLSKIFDPYFTTKEDGSGLGMATVYSIIKRHDGHISVSSKVHKGTSFSIYLPATDLKEEELKPVKNTKIQLTDLKKHEYSVLIVDDEKIVRDVLGNMLEALGYKVKAVSDGEKAILEYSESIRSGKKYDLIITDLTIPGRMGGKETAENIMKIDKTAKIIVSSGYSNDPVIANYQDYGFSGVLDKPVVIEKLNDVLSKIL